ncbi:MAG: ATP-dependent DNA helicase [Candidatus Coatesbacteria bacterium]|nr:ATP-dependent DNA helicase [Candidatus Coatesbacteria bacterium]
MSQVVLRAIKAEEHLIVEAGTGIGKSLAYLVPAIGSGKKTVVSTKTKTLQEQLLKQDLPLIRKATGARFTSACLKGRSNYLCLKRFREFERQPLFVFPGEVKHYRQIQNWAERTATGDRAELRRLPDRLAVWSDISSQRDLCLGQKCEFYRDCFMAKARQAADKADIAVVNHHLFFANLALSLALDTPLLPTPKVLVFDEARDIEQVASQFLGISVGPAQIGDLVNRINRQLTVEKIEIEGLASLLSRIQRSNKGFFNHFSGARARAVKISKVMLGPHVIGAKDALRDALAELSDSLAEASTNGADVLQPLSERCRETWMSLDAVCELDDERFVHWIDTQDENIQLKATPICLAETLASTIFKQVPSVILTSATLSSERSFSYIKSRLGPPEPQELMLSSSFDFRKQALLYIPLHLPLPDDPRFVEEAAAEIVKILERSMGRAFVLCTSNANMSALHELVQDRIDQQCFVQGEMPNTALLDKFRKDIGSVLFATASFWQGVDVQGDALSCVIVDKLPFAVPTDPVVEARIDRIRSERGNPFYEFQVPQAIIALKQGFGRLIRTKTDRGVLSILDKRILQKAYGRKFLESLPPCPITNEIEALDRFFH